MLNGQVSIDYEVMAKALRDHVRKKAFMSNSTIVYLKEGILIEENPKTSHCREIHPTSSKS